MNPFTATSVTGDEVGATLDRLTQPNRPSSWAVRGVAEVEPVVAHTGHAADTATHDLRSMRPGRRPSQRSRDSIMSGTLDVLIRVARKAGCTVMDDEARSLRRRDPLPDAGFSLAAPLEPSCYPVDC